MSEYGVQIPLPENRVGLDTGLTPDRAAPERRTHAKLIARVNRRLRGWSKHFGLGCPRKAFRQINRFVVERLGQYLNRRCQ